MSGIQIGKRRLAAAVFPLAIGLVVLLTANATAQTNAPPFILDDGLAAGYLTVGWPEATGAQFILQMNDGSGWRTVYQGPDQASSFSGLPDGLYRFRLRPANSEDGWSAELHARVAHHSLTRAFGFFGLGATVFLVLLGLLATARRRNRAGERA